MQTQTYLYSVGTSETGGFVNCVSLSEAQAEAKAWAKDFPGTDVNIYDIDENGEVVDTHSTYNFSGQAEW